MRTRKPNNKARYLTLAGSMAVGLGLMAPFFLPAEGGRSSSEKWYKFIPLADSQTVKDSFARNQEPLAVSRDVVANAAMKTTRQGPVRQNVSDSSPTPPVIIQPELQLANAPDTAMFSEYLQKAAWQPAARELGAHMAMAETASTGAVRRTAKRKILPAVRLPKKVYKNSSAIVKINPAGGEDNTEQAASESHEIEDKWYSWFWPLGHRVGVDKLKDEYVPFQTEESDEKAAKRNLNTLPNRPDLLVELGDGFLDTGNLHPGFEVPIIGAVWQPRLWVYLINRTTIQSFDNGFSNAERETEVANRLDVFFNLQLTGTEKILLGLRPVDRNRPNAFTRYTFSGSDKGFNDNFRIGLETLFFEGDFGSVFPVLDEAGFIPLDFGFTVGRQPLIFQEGILINDTIDAVGFIRNNIPFPGTSNFRVSGIYGWNRVDRNDGKGGDEQLFGLFTAADTHISTLNLDLIYVEGRDQDGIYAGASAIQRLPHFGGISTAFRANSSFALDKEVAGNVIGTGVLLTSEFSKTVEESDDIVYFNSFLGIGNYTQAGREAINGGPLANTGILFASPNLSTYLAEVDPFISDDVVGGAIGYQAFWDDKRRNLILEIAGRHDLSGTGFDSLGFGFQLQQAVGQHVQLQLEGFYSINEGREDGQGVRAEILFVL